MLPAVLDKLNQYNSLDSNLDSTLANKDPFCDLVFGALMTDASDGRINWKVTEKSIIATISEPEGSILDTIEIPRRRFETDLFLSESIYSQTHGELRLGLNSKRLGTIYRAAGLKDEDYLLPGSARCIPA
jgi:hypothetical protein